MNLKNITPKNIMNYLKWRFRKQYKNSHEYCDFLRSVDDAQTIVDLGCGTSPFWKATVAVDKYIEPIHRKWGE